MKSRKLLMSLIFMFFFSGCGGGSEYSKTVSETELVDEEKLPVAEVATKSREQNIENKLARYLQKSSEEKQGMKARFHKLSWGYFTGDNERWYISPTTNNSSYYGDVYSLTPIKNGKTGWGTVGKDIATIDLYTHRIFVENNLDSNSSDSYYDIGYKEWVTDSSIHKDRQWIEGHTESMKWYFFYLKNTGRWYIVNSPTYGSGTTVLKFASKDGQYDWQDTSTENLTSDFFVENNVLYLKLYSIIDRVEMIQRYNDSRTYYNNNKAVLDAQASDLVNAINFTGSRFDDNALSNLKVHFRLVGLTTASDALSRFLENTGDNFIIDIESVLEEGGAKGVVYNNIKTQIDNGNTSGVVEIKQCNWGSDDYTIGFDEKYAFGTLRIQWEKTGNSIRMFVNDIYSYDITDYSSKRRTIPLYKNAGDLVLSGNASDFYFTGHTSLISIDEIKNRASSTNYDAICTNS